MARENRPCIQQRPNPQTQQVITEDAEGGL